MDGFGTGNGKNSTNTATSSILHRGALNIHLENLQPWLPTAQLGMDVSTSIGTSRQGSSAVGTQAEYDLLSRNNGFDDGRAGTGIVLNWDNKPLDSIGIPGRINRLQLAIQAENVDDRIKAIEQELSQLKEQQLELKKEATAMMINPAQQVKTSDKSSQTNKR